VDPNTSPVQSSEDLECCVMKIFEVPEPGENIGRIFRMERDH
jgi:hypothetical protein